jgi:hypothetical protein
VKASRWLVLVVVIVASCALASCGFGASGPATPTPVPLGPLPRSILLPSGSAAPFAILGNYLAWAGIPKSSGVCPRNVIYLANVRRYRPRIIWSGSQCAVVSDIRLLPHWVVWVAGISPGGSVWAYQRKTGAVVRVAGQSQPPTTTPPCAGVDCFPNLDASTSGNVAAWSQTTFFPSGDYMSSAITGKALPRGKPKTLYATIGDCRALAAPFLVSGRLVWLQVTWPIDHLVNRATGLWRCRGPESMNVMTAEVGGVFGHGRRSRRPTRSRLITSSGRASDPQTDGRFVTYLDTFGVPASCVCSKLIAYDTRTNSVQTVAHSVTGYVLTGNVLVWIQLGRRNEQVQAARLGPERLHISNIRTLATTDVPAGVRFARTLGWPSLHRVVWELDELHGADYWIRAVIRTL